jgi:hypothetical protein
LRDGAALHVSPKAFDLLVTLLRERPRALPKADLHSRLWPATFVSDASLAMLVAEVRAVLGESARHPRFVRTIHRHGYAFQGSALEVPEDLRANPAVEQAGDASCGYWLITVSGQVPLLPGDNIIGRDPNARVWLDAASVSRRHACIRVEGDRATLEDLGSKNQTQANGARLTTVTTLEDGDELRFGSEQARFRRYAIDPTRSEADPS